MVNLAHSTDQKESNEGIPTRNFLRDLFRTCSSYIYFVVSFPDEVGCIFVFLFFVFPTRKGPVGLLLGHQMTFLDLL